MLDPADILVDIHPISGIFRVGRRRGMGRGEAGIVPAGIHEGIHRVRLALCRLAAGRAGHVAPAGMAVQRIARLVKGDVIGQADGKVFLLLGHHATVGAMHYRNRAAPVALTAQAPVAQTVIGHPAPDALRLAGGNGGGNGGLAGLYRLAGKAAHIAHTLGFHRHVCLGQGGLVLTFGHEDRRNRQAVLGRKVEIALVMRRAAKDRPGAIVHQDEVGDIDRQLPVRVQWMRHPDTGVEAHLLGRLDGFRTGAAAPAFGDKSRQRRIARLQRFCQRMVCRNGGKGCAQQRVGPRGIDLQLREPLGRAHRVKRKLQPARLADPVGLHDADLLGPVRQPVQRRQQLARIVGNAKEPLRQLAPFHQRARPPAPPVDHLFIRQHRHVDGVPVHHGGLAIDQARLQHVQEHRLLLAVVFRVAGGKLAAPVDRQAQRLHLRAHVGDVAIGPVLGVAAPFHRRIFGGHPEGIPAHRVQHAESGQGFVARDHVAHRVVAHMAHVDAPRRIGEHLQHIILGPGIADGGEDIGRVPHVLPAAFRCGGIIGHGRASCSLRCGTGVHRLQPEGPEGEGTAWSRRDCDVQKRILLFLLDLTRVKSNRACLPMGRRVCARPVRRGRISQRQACWFPGPALARSAFGPDDLPPADRPGGPNPLACGRSSLRQSDPANLPRRFACRVLWPLE